MLASQHRLGPMDIELKDSHVAVTAEFVHAFRQQYEQQQWQALTQTILRFLDVLNGARLAPLTEEEKQIISLSLRMIFLFFQDPNYQLDYPSILRLAVHATLIGNAMELIGEGNTDDIVEALADRPDRWAQQLILYSLHNEVEIDLSVAAKHNPQVLSLWWDKLFDVYRPILDDATYDRAIRMLRHPVLQKHFFYVQDGASLATSATFFCSSYLDYKGDTFVKAFMNEGVLRTLKQHLAYWPDLDAQKKPRDFNTIVIISRFYFYPHAVYRSISPLIKPLQKHFKTVLIIPVDNAKETIDHFDTEGFDAHYTFAVYEDEMKAIIEEICPGIILYIDVGMVNDSVIFSNLRLAPIQVTGYGHPLTTASKEIDYFIASADTELPEMAQEHYTEKMVLIPGLAATPLVPKYEPTHPTLDESDGVFISLAWGRHKTNLSFLRALLALFDRTSKPVKFVFSGFVPKELSHLKTTRELDDLVGPDRYLLFPSMPEHYYYPLIEGCHFGIDAHPFGSYNRIIDSLYCARPMLVKEGDHYINRAGAQILRQMELEELVASSDEELLDKAVRLIEDTDYREALSQRMMQCDIEKTLGEKNPTGGYVAAMRAILDDYHADNHHDKTPIIMTHEDLKGI